jgi:hypothetical protein
VVSSTPRPHFTPGKDPVPIVQEFGWAPGPVWTGGKSRHHRDSIPDRPARSSVAIPTELPGSQLCSIESYYLDDCEGQKRRGHGLFKCVCIVEFGRVVRGNRRKISVTVWDSVLIFFLSVTSFTCTL